MKKHTMVALIPLLMTHSAHAANWVIASWADSVVVLVDTTSIVKNGHHRKAWLRWDHTQEEETSDYPKQKYRSAKSLTYYDCTQRTSMNVQRTIYAGEQGTGSSLGSYSTKFNSSDMSEVVPDSIGEANLNFVCSWKILGDKNSNPSNYMDVPKKKNK